MPVRLTQSTTPFVYSADAQSKVIAVGDTLSVGNDVAVSSDFNNSFLLNRGSIVATQNGVSFSGSFGSIANAAEGYISGDTGVVAFSGASFTHISNAGQISGRATGVVIYGSNTSLANSGSIDGGDGSVYIVAPGAHLDNSGSILSGALGAIIFASPDGVLVNSGEINGAITGDPGAASGMTVTNTGVITGDVTLSGAADRFDGRGGMVHGLVNGGAGGDRLYGGSGDDTLAGGVGGDRMDAGKGGDDVFLYRTVADSTPKAMDLIAKHWDASDVIDVNALDANSHVKGNQDFTFGGLVSAGATLTAGQICYLRQGADTYVVADTTGDGKADFEIHIHGVVTLNAGEFVL